MHHAGAQRVKAQSDGRSFGKTAVGRTGDQASVERRMGLFF
jgi:hypothetical protein